jgi:hypothetical protein
MVAADRFNESSGRKGLPIYGCVTTGEAWQFLKLAGSEALLEPKRYYIDAVHAILGVILARVDTCRGTV